MVTFQSAMLGWYEKNERHYLWRSQTDPYKILVAEIMLQQTNADKVGPVYDEFLKKYPDTNTLAQSDLHDLKAVLRLLGLEYRVLRLWNIAQKLLVEYGGRVPSTQEGLVTLPGVGRYIASAVLCFGYSERVPLVDVNTIRLYGRVFGFWSHKNRARDDNRVWEFATTMLPETKFKEYNLALIDFGARVCTSKKPRCFQCPVSTMCLSYNTSGQTDGN